MQRLDVGLDRVLGIKRRAVAAAFEERHPRRHRIAKQRFHRESHRLLYTAVDQKLVLVRIDIRKTAARNDEMQAVRRDGAVEQMMRRACRATARFELRIGQRAHGLLLEPRRLAVGRDRNARRNAPWIVGKRLRCSSSCGANRAHAHGTSECCALQQQRAAIEKAVTGHTWDGLRPLGDVWIWSCFAPVGDTRVGYPPVPKRGRQCCAIIREVSSRPLQRI